MYMKVPKIAIVVRTRDRTQYLNRAILDICRQTFEDFQIIIVNDGGDPNSVERLVTRHAKKLRGRATVLNLNKSSGKKWFAANYGMRAATTEYVVLHDDDDTWEADFLKSAIEFLEDPNNSSYAGVATGSSLVHERTRGEKIEVVETQRFAESVNHISLYELCRHNLFPPISYVYKRSLHDEMGFYNQDLHVLGDWDFNLRVASKYDIGFINLPLANWHFRLSADENPNNQNVTSADPEGYKENQTKLLNSYLRKDLERGSFGLGFLVNSLSERDEYMGFQSRSILGEVGERINGVNAHLDATSQHIENLLNAQSSLLNHVKIHRRILRKLEKLYRTVGRRAYRRWLLSTTIRSRALYGRRSKKNLPVVICLWNRLDRVPDILAELDKQDTSRKLDVYFWNNNRPQKTKVEKVLVEYKPQGAIGSISLYNSLRNLGGIGRFYTLRWVRTKYQAPYAVMFDDDENVSTRFIEDLLAKANPRTYASLWSFRINGTYWDREELHDNESADYCGTGGSIIDCSAFDSKALITDLPDRYTFIEDLWLSWVLKQSGWELKKIETPVEFTDHGNNQFHALAAKKDEFYRYLVQSKDNFHKI